MKQHILVFIATIVLSASLISQNVIDGVLSEIEKNNTTLIAFRKHAEAEKIGNKTGIYLDNPEIEFHYLWGDPSSLGNRIDFSFSQTFDFPTVYKYQNQISDIRNQQVELEFRKQHRDILLQVKYFCFDLVYINALKAEILTRLDYAQQISTSIQSKFAIGETNILEYNKAQLNLLNLRKELESLEIERDVVLSELTRLNGGNPVDFYDGYIQSSIIPADFEQWYIAAEQSNPLLGWLKQETDISKNQEKLNRALSLPKLKAGYMSEKILNDKLQGVSLGISIPLWENKNTVKYAGAQTIALQGVEADRKLQFYNQLKALHTKAVDLQYTAIDYRQNLKKYDNTQLVKKALDKGEITLIEYILELSIYYESINNLLLLELELNKTLAQLYKYL